MVLFEGGSNAEHAVLAEELSKQIATLPPIAKELEALTKPVAVNPSVQTISGQAYIDLYT